MAEPDLDVVVVTHNSAEHVGSALGSLPACASVVVVDNRSADGSAEIARAAGARVIESDTNAGFAASANRGARTGSAPFVLFLNPDAVIDPTSVRRLVEVLERDPRVGIAGPRLRNVDGSPQRPTWPYPSVRSSWTETLGLARFRRTPPDEFVVGAAFMVRRSAFEALDGFDARYWLYAEETDLCRRAADAGWRVVLAPDAVATHIGGASGDAEPGLVFDHFNRGLEHFIVGRSGPSGLASVRAALATGSAVRAVAPGSADRRRLHRNRLRRTLTEAIRRPRSVALDSPATRAPGKGLVVCSLEPWDDVWRRNQFLVRELLELDPNRRVLFVEPPYDWVHERRHPTGRRRARGLRPLDGDGRIVRLEPGKVWPRVAGPFADRSLRRQVRRAAGSLGFDRPSLWVNDPSYAGLASATSWPAIYDITDDWTEAGGSGREARRVVRNEERLLAESGAVIVCSDGLAATRRPARPDLALIPNAVDLDHFARQRARPDDLPAGPTVVYVGTLHEDRIDVDLVEDLATTTPDASVVLVGPDALPPPVSARLAAHPNVVVLGPRPYEQVPAYLQHADVVIVPHVVSAFTESLDPIKAYECLAVGRPTVTTPVAGFRDLGAPIVVRDRTRFATTVRDQLARAAPSQPRPVPTWGERAKAFDAELLRARQREHRTARRVVFVDHCAQLSGAELALVRLLPALAVDAHVVLGEPGPLEARLRETGATVEVLALDRRLASTARDEVRIARLGIDRVASAARDTARLTRHLRALRPDLVHTNSLKAALYGGIAGRAAGVPVIWHIHDRIAEDYLPAPVVRAIRLLARVVPARVIANSEATRATLGPRARVVVVPNALAEAPTRTEPPAPRSTGPFRVAMVGRLAPWKGQDVFLRAFAAAFPDGDQQAVIVGSALFGEQGYEQELVALVTELDLAGRVTMLGFADDVASVLETVDCLVHASTLPEPFGQVIVEGMAAGLPVVASDAGGAAEIVHDGVDGLLTPPGDALALARQLVRLEADPQLRRALATGGLARARDFAPRRIAELVHAVYDEVAPATDPAPPE